MPSVRFEIDAERHRKFKTLATLEGKAIKQVMIEMIDAYIAERTGQEQRKEEDNPILKEIFGEEK